MAPGGYCFLAGGNRERSPSWCKSLKLAPSSVAFVPMPYYLSSAGCWGLSLSYKIFLTILVPLGQKVSFLGVYSKLGYSRLGGMVCPSLTEPNVLEHISSCGGPLAAGLKTFLPVVAAGRG